MLKKFLNIFKIYEWAFLVIAIITLIVLSVLSNPTSAVDVLGLIAPFFGVISAALNGKKKKYAFITYTVYVILYGIYCLFTANYGEGFLNLVFNLAMYLYTLYGFYVKPLIAKKKVATQEKTDTAQTSTEEAASSDFKINQIKPYMIVAIVIFIPLVTGLYGWILSNNFWIEGLSDTFQPYLNALATACCITAVFLASKTILWQWIFWLSYGTVGLTIWTLYYIENGSAVSLIALNICFIIMNVYSFVLWIIDFKKQKELEKLATRDTAVA